jgi:hypothetical protein
MNFSVAETMKDVKQQQRELSPLRQWLALRFDCYQRAAHASFETDAAPT